MIIRTEITLILRGEEFSPRKLSGLSNMSFTDVVEKNVTKVRLGVHKGKVAHYGSATFKTASGEKATENDYNTALYKLLYTFYDKIYEHIDESGVDDMRLWIHYVFNYEGESGLEFFPNSLLLLGKMNIPVAINMSRL